ncbi:MULTISPECIES: papain fold toxin domain-containing protein [unclassified Microcoleus]|uniref:papain fold toxin domain-containing protein n=1 Tax=unclassified Microcoleus TaxID=2642155 RepID=UPI002FCF09DD
MSDFSDEEIYREIGAIVSQYDILKCDLCAKAVLKWIAENGISGKLLKLKTKYREEFILSTRLERSEGTNESITTNGTHYGVEVRGLVFDNLSTEGLSREDWVNDFYCRRGKFIVEELESL